jgi:hypothetical protein
MVTRGYHVSLGARQCFCVRFHYSFGNADVRNMISQFPTPTFHLVMHAKSPLLFNGIEIPYFHYTLFHATNYVPHSFTTTFGRPHLGLPCIWHSILLHSEFIPLILHPICFGRISAPIISQSDVGSWIVRSRCGGENGDCSYQWR